MKKPLTLIVIGSLLLLPSILIAAARSNCVNKYKGKFDECVNLNDPNADCVMSVVFPEEYNKTCAAIGGQFDSLSKLLFYVGAFLIGWNLFSLMKGK